VCELNLEERMAGTVEKIYEFEMKINDKAFQTYLKDIKRLEEKYGVKIMPWNLTFYVEKDKTDVCQFNILEFKKYLEYNTFLANFLNFLQDLYKV